MSSNDIKIDLQDFQTILSKIGKIAGCVKVFDIDDLNYETISEFSNEIQNAKGILVEFEILPTVSLFVINDFMSFINDNTKSDCEIIFGVTTNENMPENKVKYKIVFTGLV
jgi:cell division protein FtsZ